MFGEGQVEEVAELGNDYNGHEIHHYLDDTVLDQDNCDVNDFNVHDGGCLKQAGIESDPVIIKLPPMVDRKFHLIHRVCQLGRKGHVHDHPTDETG